MNETIPNDYNQFRDGLKESHGSTSDHPQLFGPRAGDTNFIEWGTIYGPGETTGTFGAIGSSGRGDTAPTSIGCGEIAKVFWEHPERPNEGTYAIYPNASPKADLVFTGVGSPTTYTVILRTPEGSKMLDVRVDGDTYVDLDLHLHSFQPVEGILIANQECSSGPSDDWFTNQQIKGTTGRVEVPLVGYLRSYGEPGYLDRSTVNVPEPSMIGVFVLGLVTLAISRRRVKALHI